MARAGSAHPRPWLTGVGMEDRIARMAIIQVKAEAQPSMSQPQMVTGLITDIKRFAVHDGPGIRTTVFLKGCPMRCVWCHNPETQGDEPIVGWSAAQCIGCGQCVQVCPTGALERTADTLTVDRRLCVGCGMCASVCPAEAIVLHGRTATVAEVMAEVDKDRPFYDNSGGGLTVSGGEPMHQPDFTLALMQAASEMGVPVCLDTCGYAPWEAFESALPYLDLVLYDIKTADDCLHRRLTGRSSSLIEANLEALLRAGAQVLVRTPVVPGYNATVEGIGSVADFLRTLKPVPPLELLPYHELGEAKFERLGMSYPLRDVEAPGEDLMAELARTVQDRGVNCTVGQ